LKSWVAKAKKWGAKIDQAILKLGEVRVTYVVKKLTVYDNFNKSTRDYCHTYSVNVTTWGKSFKVYAYNVSWRTYYVKYIMHWSNNIIVYVPKYYQSHNILLSATTWEEAMKQYKKA
jgi:hypothetical protein